MRKPLFLDRDGVLNHDIKPYITDPAQFELFPWTIEALTLLNQAGFDLYIVTNQQGVGLGLTRPEVVEACHQKLQDALAPAGFAIRQFYVCTALKEENHPWRKPAPGMILAAGEEFDFDPTGSFLIGDNPRDIEAGSRAGCRSLLVLSGVTESPDAQDWAYPPEATFPTLLQAAQWIAERA